MPKQKVQREKLYMFEADPTKQDLNELLEQAAINQTYSFYDTDGREILVTHGGNDGLIYESRKSAKGRSITEIEKDYDAIVCCHPNRVVQNVPFDIFGETEDEDKNILFDWYKGVVYVSRWVKKDAWENVERIILCIHVDKKEMDLAINALKKNGGTIPDTLKLHI